jgi:DNA-binding NarL/FixJ family response regulator
MAAVAILSADLDLRRSLEQLPYGNPAVAVVGFVDRVSDLLQLVSDHQADVVLMDAPTREQLEEWQATHNHIPLLVLLRAIMPGDVIDALSAGARAILSRSADRTEIIAAIMAATRGLVLLQPEHLKAMLDDTWVAGEPCEDAVPERVQLTHREREVLALMANGASNKAIARQLGISFHTAKFHVAAILAKLNADSRTEAVMKAAQAGLVML